MTTSPAGPPRLWPFAASIAWLALACGETAPPTAQTAPTVASSPTLEAEPAALLEGPLQAMGLRLPVGSRFKVQMPRYVVAHVPYGAERVSNYLRERVEGTADVGPQRTVFASATPKGPGAPPPVMIVVAPDGFGSKVTIKQLD
jgi:hypothetical protein